MFDEAPPTFAPVRVRGLKHSYFVTAVEGSRFAPVRVRGLKHSHRGGFHGGSSFAPVRVRGLKQRLAPAGVHGLRFAPVRVRGLKHIHRAEYGNDRNVRTRAGAWIETSSERMVLPARGGSHPCGCVD